MGGLLKKEGRFIEDWVFEYGGHTIPLIAISKALNIVFIIIIFSLGYNLGIYTELEHQKATIYNGGGAFNESSGKVVQCPLKVSENGDLYYDCSQHTTNLSNFNGFNRIFP